MTPEQLVAITNATLVPEEQARPMFAHRADHGTLVLTVRRGWG